MGGGSWSTDFYRDQEQERQRRGRSTFAYHADVSARPASQRRVHASLDPKGVAIRESRDSEEHPESNAVAVFFDVTGSMQEIPQLLQKKLPSLMDTLNASGYIPHPQVFFGAVGDATSDRAPLQVGQYESDNRVNEAFENMYLEGNGGGQMRESYEIAMYFASRRMSCDCFEKRGRKGYLFLIGDELPYEVVSKTLVNGLLGDGALEADIPIEQIVADLQERFHVFMIIPSGTFHGNDPRVQKRWRDLLGENVLLTDDIGAICEIIAMKIGMMEKSIDLNKAREDLQKHGSDLQAVNAAASAVSGGAFVPAAGAVTRL